MRMVHSLCGTTGANGNKWISSKMVERFYYSPHRDYAALRADTIKRYISTSPDAVCNAMPQCHSASMPWCLCYDVLTFFMERTQRHHHANVLFTSVTTTRARHSVCYIRAIAMRLSTHGYLFIIPLPFHSFVFFLFLLRTSIDNNV